MSAQKFPATSRYYSIKTSEFTLVDGTKVSYLRRRFLPQVEKFSVIATHVVSQGERLDHIAAENLGDSEQAWRIADANGALHPRDLLELGSELNITLPEGVPGVVTE
jgi:hypothetical protein